MKTIINRYGDWYCGRLTFTRGRWQIGFTQDLTSYKVGLSMGRLYLMELVFLCWSFDCSRLGHMDASWYEWDEEMKKQPLPPEWVKAIDEALTKEIGSDHPRET